MPTKQFAAIPTIHKGVRYRSRLEARWAAFFDLLGWQFEYEPFECNGWIPDFVLIGKKRNTLVEVKPLLQDIDEAKVSVPGYETLCVSAMPFTDFSLKSDPDQKFQADGTPLGALINGYADGWPRTDIAIFNSQDGSTFDFRAECGSYGERVWGVSEAGSDDHLRWASRNTTFLRRIVTDKWKEAGNTTQWRGVK